MMSDFRVELGEVFMLFLSGREKRRSNGIIICKGLGF